MLYKHGKARQRCASLPLDEVQTSDEFDPPTREMRSTPDAQIRRDLCDTIREAARCAPRLFWLRGHQHDLDEAEQNEMKRQRDEAFADRR
jgi:hypothetical protein